MYFTIFVADLLQILNRPNVPIQFVKIITT